MQNTTIKQIMDRRRMPWYRKAWLRLRRWSPVNYVRQFWYGLENLWAYLPLIWRDRDWDWAYLYEMIEFKLHRMAKLQRTYGCALNSEEMAREMEVCAMLLQRLREEDYDTDSFAEEMALARKDLRKFCWLFYRRSKGWWD